MIKGWRLIPELVERRERLAKERLERLNASERSEALRKALTLAMAREQCRIEIEREHLEPA